MVTITQETKALVCLIRDQNVKDVLKKQGTYNLFTKKKAANDWSKDSGQNP